MHYIKLKDTIFEVRKVKGRGQIKVDNKWLDHLDFIQYLVSNSKYSELAQLAMLGYNVQNENS